MESIVCAGIYMEIVVVFGADARRGEIGGDASTSAVDDDIHYFLINNTINYQIFLHSYIVSTFMGSAVLFIPVFPAGLQCTARRREEIMTFTSTMAFHHKHSHVRMLKNIPHQSTNSPSRVHVMRSASGIACD